MADLESDIAYHARLVDMFQDAEQAFDKNRERAERDIDYYDGKQWTEEEVRDLKRRGQPAITWNRIREKIDFLQGQERTQRTKPKALPRTPQHQDDSYSATDALQFVCQENDYDELRSRAWGDLLKAGWGGLEITVEQRMSRQDMMASTAMAGGEYRVTMTRCQWDRMFWDPYSAEEDFSDASYLGMVLWMDRQEAVRRYGDGAGQVFDDTVSFASTGGSFDDRPKYMTWSSTGKRQRVRVVQMYFLSDDGEWDYCEFTKGGVLRDGPSPWLDEDGKREHPYAWRSAYVDRDNNRYGAVRDMIDLQDEVNKRRSKALHHFTSRQTFGNAKFDQNSNENKKQLAKPDGHVKLVGEAEFGKDFGIIPTLDQAQGHFELLQQATTAFETTMGPNQAMQGRSRSGESGRSILAQQQGGAIQMGTLTDSLRQLDFDAYRKAWNRIRQYWTGETWIRVTDDERNMRFVTLNEPAFDEQTGQMVVRNNIAELDVDILIDEAPASGALLDEQWQGLVGLAQAGVIFPPQVYIKSMPNLRNRDELVQVLEQQGQQPPNPLEIAGAEAEVAERQASAAQKGAAARKTNAEAMQTEIETDVGMALAAATNPQPVAQPAY